MSKQLGKTLIKLLPKINKKEILTRHMSDCANKNIPLSNTEKVMSFMVTTYIAGTSLLGTIVLFGGSRW